MFVALAGNASHPTVAALLGLGAAGLAAAVVAMAWSVHARQIRLAERLARRQFLVIPDAGTPGQHGSPAAGEQAGRGNGTAVTGLVPRRSVIPSRTRTMSVRSPGWSAIKSSSSGWAGSGDCETAPPPAAHATTLRLPEGRTR